METEAPHPSRGLPLRLFWTLLALIVIGYPLSFGPLAYWTRLNASKPVPVWMQKYFSPLYWLSENAEWAVKPLKKYMNACDRLATKHREARLPAVSATPPPAPAP